MGWPIAGVGFFIVLFPAVASVAVAIFVAAGTGDPCHTAGFASWFVFAQGSYVQTDAHVGRGEVNQRRRQLVEPNSTRLPLLVATAADGIRLVGRQESRMVQVFFRRVLPRSGNH